MIPSQAIAEYLNSQRADHRWLKKKSAAYVRALLKRDYPAFRPYSKLKQHQLVACYLGLKYPCFAMYLDMGLGKTLASLELLRYWWEQGYLRRALIFVISDKAFATWERQIAQYDIRIPYVTLDGSSVDKWRMLEGFRDGLVLLHYPGTVAQTALRLKGGWDIDEEQLERLAYHVDALVLDEITKCAGDSLTNKLCRKLRKNVGICYGLSGRPFGRDPTLLWKCQRLVDNGVSLGETIGLFREAFFESKPMFGKDGKVKKVRRMTKRMKYARDYTFQKKLMPQLTRMVQHRSITYTAKECIDLPPVVPVIEEVRLPEEATSYYRKLVENVVAAKGNYREMKNAFTRMRQISSGFLAFRDDDSGERAEVAFAVNPKLDRVLELVDAVPEDRSIVIGYEFTWFGRKLVEALEERGVNCMWLWSGTKNPRRVLDSFTDGEVQVAVIQNKIGAYSLDGLQIANYQIFAESPVSVIDREQAERRVERQGQKFTIFRYDVVVRGTLDRRILEYHREGAELFAALTRDPREILRAA